MSARREFRPRLRVLRNQRPAPRLALPADAGERRVGAAAAVLALVLVATIAAAWVVGAALRAW